MSTGSLQPHEQELLSALLDDELTEAEHAQAQKLLQRAEAREYLSQLSAGRELVKRYAKARAPVGLSARVMSALEGGFDDVSRPVNNQATPTAAAPGKVHQMGSFSWRTPLFAAAAVVVVSMGMIFGPQLWTPQGAQGDGIAREVIEQGRGSAPPELKKTGGDVLELDELLDKTDGQNWAESSVDESLRRVRRDAANSNSLDDPTEDAAENGNSVPESLDASRSMQPMKPKKDAGTNESGRKNADSKHAETEGKSDAVGLGGGAGGGGRTGATEEPKHAELRRAETPPAPNPAAPADQPPGNPTVEKEPGSSTEPGAKAKEEAGNDAGKQAGTQADKDAKPRSGGGYGEGGSYHGDGGGAGRAGSPRPATAPKVKKGAATDGRQNDDANAEAGGTAAEIVTLSLTDKDDILAAMADVLWVANLYGEVGLNEDDAVVIDLDASSKAALLTAIRKLATEQKYGSLDQDAAKLADPAAEAANGPAGFVPAERAKATKADEGAERIRLVVRLK